MANIKQVKQDTLAIIDAALAILNRFPDLGQSSTELSTNTSLNPFSFLLDLFKSTAGYNQVIEILARFIAYELPAVEAAIKALLISQLREILSCSVNPFLTEEILREGIVFNIDEIDIADVLKYSPFDKKVGRYFYFGTEEAHMPDDLIHCNDMDAFIWFMINKSNRRYVWKPLAYRNDDNPSKDYETKTAKSDGIITLEYYEKSQNLRDAEGKNYNVQTPYNSCLHVFIGDVRENQIKIDKLITDENNLSQVEKEIEDFNSKIEIEQNKREEIENKRNELDEKLSKQEIDKNTYTSSYNSYIKQLNNINNQLNQYEAERQNKYQTKHGLQYKIGNYDLKAMADSAIFYPINSALGIRNHRNYYYGHTLIEFNIDYIMSLRFFEEKVLAARLIESLTGILTIDLALSYKQQLIKNEVKKMVSMVVESDDLVVSDCFFTFSNNDYDALSRQAELRKAGLLSINGDETSAVKLNAEDVLSGLNELNESTSKETIQSIIEGTITSLSKELSSVTYEENDKLNFGVQINFIENLMTHLAYVLVSAVLSPKVYLLLLINLRILGRETNFNLEQFLGSYKELIATLIRAIRDMLIEYLVKELMKIIGDLVREVAYKLTLEQAAYYRRLIKKLIDCFKKHGRSLDFSIDDVDYADILASDNEPTNAEC